MTCFENRCMKNSFLNVTKNSKVLITRENLGIKNITISTMYIVYALYARSIKIFIYILMKMIIT